MNHTAILQHLHQRGLIHSTQASVTPLSGGVSCDIVMIDDGQRRVVVKRALAKLKVKDDWFADVSRNRYEHEYMRYVAGFLPSAVPRVIDADDTAGFFVMEHLGDGYVNWKSMLLRGEADVAHARQAGEILGMIHSRSWNDDEARKKFATDNNFFQLRLDPYILTTGRRHPDLQKHFETEANRIATTHLCLVHGDYSPKNMLIGPDGRIVVLDCEVAWFGEPAFDMAFLLNHFMLKALLHRDQPRAMLAMVEATWQAYQQKLSSEQRGDIEQRIARLLLMLMLARIDGKSPVEYLTTDLQKNTVRAFTTKHIPQPPRTLAEVVGEWHAQLALFPA